MKCEPETAPQIQARNKPDWPKHYAPMSPLVHGWWLKAQLPFHRDCPACLRSRGGPADPRRFDHIPLADNNS